jgi:hypothetical protein
VNRIFFYIKNDAGRRCIVFVIHSCSTQEIASLHKNRLKH